MKGLKNKLLSPWMQMTMAMVGLCGTLVLLADVFFAVLPDPQRQLQQQRQQFASALAAQLAVVLERNDPDLLQNTLDVAKERIPALNSAAVRRHDGSLHAQAGDHQRHWLVAAEPASMPHQVSVALDADGAPWGRVELAYSPDRRGAIGSFFHQPLVTTLLFIFGAGTLAFALYLRRALQHLDPASAIPERVQVAFDVMVEGVVMIDDRGRVLLANQAFGRLLGGTATPSPGSVLSALPCLAASLAAPAAQHPWMRAISERSTLSGVPLTLNLGDGEPRRVLVNCQTITDAGGAVRGCMVTFDDVSQLHRSNQALQDAVTQLDLSHREIQRQNVELERLSTRDPLTGCLNRRALLQAFEQQIATAQTNSEPLACVMIDIDHFKSVNDRHGHAIGDRVIQEVAKRLQACARGSDLVGRYGGEEFCVVVPGLDADGAAAFAERVRQRIEAECGQAVREIDGLRITASLGVQALGAQASTPALMMDHADQALYRAKHEGRNRVRVFEARDVSLEATA